MKFLILLITLVAMLMTAQAFRLQTEAYTERQIRSDYSHCKRSCYGWAACEACTKRRDAALKKLR